MCLRFQEGGEKKKKSSETVCQQSGLCVCSASRRRMRMRTSRLGVWSGRNRSGTQADGEDHVARVPHEYKHRLCRCFS